MTTTVTDPSKENKKAFRVEGMDKTVTLRRLRAMDKIEAGIVQSSILKGLNTSSLNGEAQEFSYLLACLKVALVEPLDFPLDDLDSEDLVQVWGEWDKWSRSFRKPRPTGVGATS